MFTCQFYGFAAAELISEGLDLLLVDSALGRLHKVDLCGLLEDLLGHLEGLVKVGLDQRVSQLLPVRSF